MTLVLGSDAKPSAVYSRVVANQDPVFADSAEHVRDWKDDSGVEERSEEKALKGRA